MNKLIFTITFLFFHLSLFSQDESFENKYFKSISVNLKQVHLKSDNESHSNIKPGFGYGIEANYFYSPNSKWAIKTGLELSCLSSKMKDYSLVFGSDLTGGMGQSGQTSFIESEMKSYYAGIPIEFQINILNKKSRLYLKAGGEVLVNLFDDNSAMLHESGLSPREVDNSWHDSERVIGEANFGMGYEFNIHSKAKLFLEPNIEYHLTNIIAPASAFSEVEKSRRLNYGLKILESRFSSFN